MTLVDVGLVDELRQTRFFENSPAEEIRWAAERGTIVKLAPGERVIAEGDETASFHIVLEGELKITKNVGGEEMVLTQHKVGDFTGALRLLTGGPSSASVWAVPATRLFRLCLDDFRELLVRSKETRDAIMRALALREHEMESTTQQRERLTALGKLAAGLAHELNNPAAAARSSAGRLRDTFTEIRTLAVKLHKAKLTSEEWDALAKLEAEAVERAQSAPPLDSLTQSDREDEVATWLEEHDVDLSWELAPTLVAAGLDIDWLETTAAALGPAVLSPALDWIETTLTANDLTHHVETSTARISELVQAIKEYSYMDQAPRQDVDVHQGIENTLKIMHHKLKNGVEVVRQYDPNLPRITAFGSELNQVWTNIIDNAIDAMDGKGRLLVKTLCEGGNILVEFADNGPGIPEAVRPHIFEPFFTTKGVGKGTGLGLDTAYRIIVNRHRGDIAVTSSPEGTMFCIRIPRHAE
ncbi:MAG: cyclic nucleotide-binding domain-containing protein [Chloroflexi bacterium]|nr:cyclic nucleotide-binding domain-containing protein [Chloroflexota bacterium]